MPYKNEIRKLQGEYKRTLRHADRIKLRIDQLLARDLVHTKTLGRGGRK